MDTTYYRNGNHDCTSPQYRTTRRNFLATTGFILGAMTSVAGCSSVISPPPYEAETAWEPGVPMATERTEVIATVLDNKLYVIGGIEPGRVASTTVAIFDPNVGSWEVGPPLPVGLHHTTAVAHDGNIYVVGGYQNQWDPVNTVYQFDGSTWTERKPMPTVRGALAAAVHDGRIYATGGVGIDDVTNAFEIYDIEADTWSSGPAMPTAREHLTAAVVDGNFYAIGGRMGNLFSNLRTTERYDPTTNEWQAVAAMPTARSGFGATTVNGVIVVMGGESPNGTNSQVEVYNPAEDTWSALPDMPTPRHGLGVATLGNRIFAAAGGPEPGFVYSDAVEVLTFENAAFDQVTRTVESFFCNLPIVGGLLRGSLC